MKAKEKSKAKPVHPSWASEAPPARPQCRRCGVELYLVKSLEVRACGDCRDYFGRLAEQAKRVNSGKEGSLPAALTRSFAVRTGARVGDE
jgi:ribosomal protein L37E